MGQNVVMAYYFYSLAVSATIFIAKFILFTMNQQLYSKVVQMSQIFNTYVIGQPKLFKFIFMAFATQSHVLIEGVPGLAKTRAVNLMADLVKAQFNRIQFTPDLLPTDIVGSEVFNVQTGQFYIRRGPIFANVILADEINRAPAKVQSALLEAMQEKQVTIAGKTQKLPDFFVVLATENPIEQEGTFPLSEAQTDRFAAKLIVGYPSLESELKILELQEKTGDSWSVDPIFTPEEFLKLGQMIGSIKVVSELKKYIVRLVDATRRPENYGLREIAKYIRLGASPRASIYLMKLGKVEAFLNQRDFVLPDDIKNIAYEVLRHRILLSFEAQADGVNQDEIVKHILEKVPVPNIK